VFKIEYFSMFSGIGGFELGIRKAHPDWKCVGYSEIDKYAIQTYKRHFPDHKNWGNARDLIPEELPDFDLLCGGFPCQSFSIAGKRKGFSDTRGTLFFDIARIAAVKRPKMLLLENVKGLLNHDKGSTFAKILETLWELGYDVEWCVLNSKNFGVPQNRERVFIIGHLGGFSRGKVFPIRETSQQLNQRNAEKQNVSSLQAPGHSCGNYNGMNMIYEKLGPIYSNGDVAQANRCYLPEGIVTSQGDRGPYIKQLNQPHHSNNRVYSDEGISPSLNTMQGGNRQPFVKAVLTPNRPEKSQNGRRFKEDGEEMFTLTGQDIHGVMLDSRIRRLTPIECERLQGFPEIERNGWTKYGINEQGEQVENSDTQRYKQCGNAVTVNVIESIVRCLPLDVKQKGGRHS